MKNNLFERLPNEVAQQTKTVTRIEGLPNFENGQHTIELSDDKWFNVDELSVYLPDRPSRRTIYRKVSRREIPFYKKGKRLYFLKSEVNEWLRSGRHRTQTELMQDAKQYVWGKRNGVN